VTLNHTKGTVHAGSLPGPVSPCEVNSAFILQIARTLLVWDWCNIQRHPDVHVLLARREDIWRVRPECANVLLTLQRISTLSTGLPTTMFDFPVGEHSPGMDAYRSTSLFQPHRTRQAIRDAHARKVQPLMGMYLAVSSIPVGRLVAPLVFDAVWIDWKHSLCNVETMTTIVHEIMFMSEGRTIPFVRIPGHDHASIGYALDAGASTIAPQVDTVEQARHIISAGKFGSRKRGTRSPPPFRPLPGITDLPYDSDKTLYENLNDQSTIVIQVETPEGINNLDDILTACPKINAVWLGTLVCHVSMDLPANFGVGMNRSGLKRKPSTPRP